MWSRAGPKGPKARARFALYSHPIHPVLSLLGFRVFFYWGGWLLAPGQRLLALQRSSSISSSIVKHSGSSSINGSA